MGNQVIEFSNQGFNQRMNNFNNIRVNPNIQNNVCILQYLIIFVQYYNIKGTSENVTITNDLIKLTISGVGNNVTIKSHVKSLRISGTGNTVNGLDPNCLIDDINIQGLSNEINLNQNCSNVNKNISGLNNQLKFNGVAFNVGNNFNNMRNNVNINRNFVRITNNNGNVQNNVFFDNNNMNNMNEINELINDFRDFGINVNLNNRNANVRVNVVNNVNNNVEEDNDNDDDNNLSDFNRKKQNLFLEMDEYQYKHIQKYESRKETECAICLEEFKGIDIIKAFYKCEHIFHKNCLQNWLKRSNVCPLCKHDLREDINKMH